ncbi:UNVERIFIED_CONTAM: hypothetical protein FKN15_042831 [Acipenser sinensis]
MGNQIEKHIPQQQVSYRALTNQELQGQGPREEESGAWECEHIPGSDDAEKDALLKRQLHAGELCAAFYLGKCIYERPCSEPSAVEVLLSLCKPGDLIQFLSKEGRGGEHWAVCVGGAQAVHWQAGSVRKSFLLDVSAGQHGRMANSSYKYSQSSARVVVRRALEEAESGGGEWRNSECFAAWCKYGRREFKRDGEVRIGRRPYTLHLQQADGTLETAAFQCLVDLIEERQRLEQGEGTATNRIL